MRQKNGILAAWFAVLLPTAICLHGDISIVPKQESHLWAVLIGVSAYDDPAIPALPSAEEDAQALKKVLTEGPGSYAADQVQVRAGSEATRSKVILALRQTLAKAAAGDTVFLYFGGVADLDGETLLLALKDFYGLDPVNTGLPFSLVAELLGNCAAKNFFVCLDTCHAGAALPEVAKLNRKGKNCVFLLPCSVREMAIEHRESQHGALTHFLLEGLNGKAKTSAAGTILAADAAHYASVALVLYLKERGLRARPVTVVADGQFPLIRVAPRPPQAPAARRTTEATEGTR